jgi:hypothetical protein
LRGKICAQEGASPDGLRRKQGFEGYPDATGTGHLVEARVLFDKLCREIDCQLLATREELGHLADGVYSFDELEELHLKRLAEEQAAE